MSVLKLNLSNLKYWIIFNASKGWYTKQYLILFTVVQINIIYLKITLVQLCEDPLMFTHFDTRSPSGRRHGGNDVMCDFVQCRPLESQLAITEHYWTNKENRDRLIDRGQIDSYGGEVRGGGVQQKGKRTHGHRQLCGDCSGGEGSVRGLNGNAKKYNKT